jgi:LacI family transcriptional regulator/LacI family repressor for deo operon, udp, cdd, tsx, nupC, and nupG
MPNQKRISVLDVARKAGVSISTVSRVINGEKSIKPETLAKVQRAIARLGYKPNLAAQRLRRRKGRRKIIGLLIPDIQNPFYVEVIRGVEDVAFQQQYAVLMSNFAQEEEKENFYLDQMMAEAVDGIIVAPSHGRYQKVIELVRSGFPIVCVDRGLTDIESDVVLVNNHQGAYDAVEHLLQRGHTRIAYIGGIPAIPTTQQRRQGYIDALTRHGIEIKPDYIRTGNSKHESGRTLANDLLDLALPPTAFFTGNNLITLGALETIHSRGQRIPDDIAMVGFDDMPWSISLNPPLTAVSQPGYEIGGRAAEMLFQRINDPQRQPVSQIFRAKLIIRKST